MSTLTGLITAEQLLAMGDVGRCELVGGEVVHMAPAGAEHGDISLGLGYRIRAFVEQRRLGKAFGAETGFVIRRNPDTVRAPDVAFVRKERIPSHPVRGFFPGAPDLAVEVVSPSDLLSDVAAKVDQWLEAGAASVWVVDPPNQSIVIYRAGNVVVRYRGPDVLADEPTLPGFELRLDDLFESRL